jgi:hypothetical protein
VLTTATSYFGFLFSLLFSGTATATAVIVGVLDFATPTSLASEGRRVRATCGTIHARQTYRHRLNRQCDDQQKIDGNTS